MWMLMVCQMQAWSDVLARLGTLGRSAEQGAIALSIAVVALCAGWGVAAVVSRLLRRLLRAVRFDEGVRGLIGARAAARHEPAGIAAWAVYWLVMACTALLALELMGFNLAASVGDRLGEVIPRIVAAAVLFTVGSLVAMVLGGITRKFLETAGVRTARLQGQVVSVVLTGFAALLALEQLGFAAQFVMAVGIVSLTAVGLGLALAFGLGCRELARDFVVEYLRSLDDDRPKRPE
jgi:hypothetical protein